VENGISYEDSIKNKKLKEFISDEEE